MGEREIWIPIIVFLALFLGMVPVGAAITLPGVIAYYSFEGNASDTAGSYQGTVYGAIPDQGVSGSSYSFNGIKNHISLPRTIGDDFTIVFWVSTTQTAAATPQWYKGNGLVDAEIYDVGNDFGTALLGSKASFGVGNPDYTILSITDINDGRWHQVVAERSKSSGEMKLYVDGTLEAKGTGSKNSLSDPPFIGVGNNPCDISYNREWFNGKIDEIQIYSRILTDEEIQKLYKSVRYQVPVKFTLQPTTSVAGTGQTVSANRILTDGGAAPEISAYSDLSYMNWPVFYQIVQPPPNTSRRAEPGYLLIPGLLVLCSLLVLIFVFFKSRKTRSKTPRMQAVRIVVSVLFIMVFVASCSSLVFEIARVNKDTDVSLVKLGLKNATYFDYPNYWDRQQSYSLYISGYYCNIDDPACMYRQQQMQQQMQQAIQQQNMINQQNYQVQQQIQQVGRLSRGF